MYEHHHSTKEDERLHRENDQTIPNEFFKPDSIFPFISKFKNILQSQQNKKRLQKFILSALKNKAIHTESHIIYSTGMQCQDVATGVDVKKYQFDHSEADTIMISVYAHLRENGYTSPVVLDVADTDVYVTASYAANKYNGDLLIRRGGDFLNCKTLFDESVVDCLIQFHAVTGCDASSSYYGTSKGKLFDKLINSDRAKQQLKKYGDCVELTPECKANLLLFTR